MSNKEYRSAAADIEKGSGNDTAHPESPNIQGEYDNQGLQRQLKNRHAQMITIGGSFACSIILCADHRLTVTGGVIGTGEDSHGPLVSNELTVLDG
jgi:amino acid permease